MFYRGYSILTALARPETLPSPRAPGTLKEWASGNARLAMSRVLPGMQLSDRLNDPAAYLRLQAGRRQALEAMLVAEPEKATLTRAIDLICMIAEESCWSENPSGALFDDDRHPEIDFQCAETLMLFAWANRGYGELLGSRVSGKLLYEARRRVFTPILAHGDYPFMRGRGRRPLCILSDILLSAILLETDAQRLGALIKLCLRLIDQVIQGRDNRAEALEDALAETAAITDLTLLLRRVTRNELDLTDLYPTPDWLDALLFSWIDGLYFLDPAAERMKPELSGAELFRVGLSANDEALTALGARLHQARHLPSATLTGRILDMSCAGMLEAQAVKPPRLKHAATAHNRLMLSRFAGMTCAMHTGGGKGNAGNLVLFAGSRPILVESPAAKNLPLIGRHAQLDRPDAGPGFDTDGLCPADFQVRQDRELMSVDLTHAYPVAADVRSYQRTAMILRDQEALRLVDAFDLTTSAAVAFRFVTPEKPEALMSGLRLGPVDMTWDGELRSTVQTLNVRFPEDAAGQPLYLIELTSPQAVSRAFFTFNFMQN